MFLIGTPTPMGETKEQSTTLSRQPESGFLNIGDMCPTFKNPNSYLHVMMSSLKASGNTSPRIVQDHTVSPLVWRRDNPPVSSVEERGYYKITCGKSGACVMHSILKGMSKTYQLTYELDNKTVITPDEITTVSNFLNPNTHNPVWEGAPIPPNIFEYVNGDLVIPDEKRAIWTKFLVDYRDASAKSLRFEIAELLYPTNSITTTVQQRATPERKILRDMYPQMFESLYSGWPANQGKGPVSYPTIPSEFPDFDADTGEPNIHAGRPIPEQLIKLAQEEYDDVLFEFLACQLKSLGTVSYFFIHFITNILNSTGAALDVYVVNSKSLGDSSKEVFYDKNFHDANTGDPIGSTVVFLREPGEGYSIIGAIDNKNLSTENINYRLPNEDALARTLWDMVA
jgi:hypothetical protein